jgi:hypothetical protein
MPPNSGTEVDGASNELRNATEQVFDEKYDVTCCLLRAPILERNQDAQ